MNQQYRPTGETAVIIVPPADICAYADHYRGLYQPDQLRRIEPHITVTHPFVRYDSLAEATPRLEAALRECPPVRISLRGFGLFKGTPGFLYLRLADPGRVLSIYRAVLAEFPDCRAYRGEYGDDWEPHMTVGEFSDPAELERVFEELSGQKLYIGFDADYVAIKSKMDDGVWDTWAEVPLGGTEPPC